MMRVKINSFNFNYTLNFIEFSVVYGTQIHTVFVYLEG